MLLLVRRTGDGQGAARSRRLSLLQFHGQRRRWKQLGHDTVGHHLVAGRVECPAIDGEVGVGEAVSEFLERSVEVQVGVVVRESEVGQRGVVAVDLLIPRNGNF